jgi:hypothetical protein
MDSRRMNVMQNVKQKYKRVLLLVLQLLSTNCGVDCLTRYFRIKATSIPGMYVRLGLMHTTWTKTLVPKVLSSVVAPVVYLLIQSFQELFVSHRFEFKCD